MSRSSSRATRTAAHAVPAGSATAAAGASPAAKRRIVSLDAFRAAAVALMILMDHPTFQEGIPLFMRHPEWHGFRLPDYVFPAFLFIAGVSLAFSTRKRDTSVLRASIPFARREIIVFVLGLGLNWAKYGLPLRIMGVLQRISLSLAIVWPFTRARARWAVLAAALLLAAYSWVFLYAEAPGVTPGTTAKASSISGWVDTEVWGLEHTYKQTGFDPEGLLGTLPAAALALIGLAAGKRLIDRPDDPMELLVMGSYGAALIGLALWMHRIIPINKKLWTSSFTMVSAGVSLIVLAALYYIADHRGHHRLVDWLIPMGRNALFLYIASNMLVVAGRQWITVRYGSQSMPVWDAVGAWLTHRVGLGNASLAISVAEVTFWFAVAAVMHWRKWYVKI